MDAIDRMRRFLDGDAESTEPELADPHAGTHGDHATVIMGDDDEWYCHTCETTYRLPTDLPPDV